LSDKELHIDILFALVAQFAEKSIVAAQKLKQRFSWLSSPQRRRFPIRRVPSA
jgi:hypothetical protein